MARLVDRQRYLFLNVIQERSLAFETICVPRGVGKSDEMPVLLLYVYFDLSEEINEGVEGVRAFPVGVEESLIAALGKERGHCYL